jgi:GT2 family glycosyltransferase
MKEKKPFVCIGLVNFNGERMTSECLRTLKITKYPNYKVIVLDNGSSDDSYSKLKEKFPDVDVIKSEKNLGYAGGMNFVWNYCLNKYNPDYMCNINNDVVTIQPIWLDLLVDELEKDKLRGIAAPRSFFPSKALQKLFWGNRIPYDFSKENKALSLSVKEVPLVNGAVLLIKRNVIDKIGGDDENYFFGPDDQDYALRAKKAGFKLVYCGKSKAVHVSSFSSSTSKKDFIYKHQSYGQILFQFRHGTKKEIMSMVTQQFMRIFFTKKTSFEKVSLKNKYFHKTFPRRLLYFFQALINSIKNYKKIKIGDYPILKR